MKYTILGPLALICVWFASGCSSQPVLPETDSIQVSREAPKNCQNLGKVTGTTSTVKAGPEDALQDMKKEAADKGATHLVVLQYSGNRTSVTGEAYQCQ